MEPRIQYAKTTDGVSIAYWTLGSGKPFLQMPTIPFSHIELEWEAEASRRFAERLAERHKLIRYDARGTGLSDRGFKTQSIEGYCADLDAVLDRTVDQKVILMAPVNMGPVGIAYTVAQPRRVSHLVLWNTYACGEDLYQLPALQAFKALRHQDWDIYINTVAHTAMGWSGDEAARWAEVLRSSVTLEDAEPAFETIEAFDVTDQLALVTVPTLVLHRRDAAIADVQIARKLAASIPDASLTILDGVSIAPTGAEDQTMNALAEFLGDESRAAPLPRADHPAELVALRTVLFTDLVGHTEMMSRLGDEKGREVLREHERITREVLAEHGGAEVKTMGDGFMASFGSVTKSVECAIALQKAFAEREGEPLSIRVGLNAGEPIEEDGDLFGATVILASRIAAKAQGGEILVSDNVRSLSAGKGFLFADRGEFVAKGFEEPVRVYEVSWREAE